MVKKTGIILAIFIIFIMVTSILGFMSGGNEETIKYKGYKFTKVQNGWLGYINNQKIFLSNNPNNLEDIKIDIDLTNLNYAEKIYLSVNPQDNLILYSFENIGSLLIPKIIRACNEDVSGCENLLIKTCDDATINVKVFLIKKADKLEYNYKYNCLLIKGDTEEIKKVLDKITLELLT